MLDFYDAYSLYEQGTQALKEKKFEKARCAFQTALNVDSKNVLCLEKMMILSFVTGEYSNSLVFAEKLLESAPYNVKASSIKLYLETFKLNPKFCTLLIDKPFKFCKEIIDLIQDYKKTFPPLKLDTNIVISSPENLYYSWYNLLKTYRNSFNYDIVSHCKLIDFQKYYKGLEQRIHILESTAYNNDGFDQDYCMQDDAERSLKFSLENNEEIVALSPSKRFSRKRKKIEGIDSDAELYVIKRRSARVKNVRKSKDSSVVERSFLQTVLSVDAGILPLQMHTFVSTKRAYYPLWGGNIPHIGQASSAILGLNPAAVHYLKARGSAKLLPQHVVAVIEDPQAANNLGSNCDGVLGEAKAIQAFLDRLLCCENNNQKESTLTCPILSAIKQTLIEISLASTHQSLASLSVRCFPESSTIWSSEFRCTFLNVFSNALVKPLFGNFDSITLRGLAPNPELKGCSGSSFFKLINSWLPDGSTEIGLVSDAYALILLLTVLESQVDLHLCHLILIDENQQLIGGANSNDDPLLNSKEILPKTTQDVNMEEVDKGKETHSAERQPFFACPTFSATPISEIFVPGTALTSISNLVSVRLRDLEVPLIETGNGEELNSCTKRIDRFLRFALLIRWYRVQILTLWFQNIGVGAEHLDDQVFRDQALRCLVLMNKSRELFKDLHQKGCENDKSLLKLNHCTLYNVWTVDIIMSGPWKDLTTNLLPCVEQQNLPLALGNYSRLGIPLAVEALDDLLQILNKDNGINLGLNQLAAYLEGVLWNNLVPQACVSRLKAVAEKLVELLTSKLAGSCPVFDTCFQWDTNSENNQEGQPNAWTLFYELLLFCATATFSLETAVKQHQQSQNGRKDSGGVLKTPTGLTLTADDGFTFPLAPLVALYRMLDLYEKREKSLGANLKNQMPPSLKFLDLCHEFLGKHALCSLNNGLFLKLYVDSFYSEAQRVANLLHNHQAPEPKVARNGGTYAPLSDHDIEALEDYKETLKERVEQGFYCTYEFVQRKWKMKYLKDHGLCQKIPFTWDQAGTLFNFLKPFVPPEFHTRTFTVNSEVKDMLEYMLKFYHCRNLKTNHQDMMDIMDCLKEGLSAGMMKKIKAITSFIEQGLFSDELNKLKESSISHLEEETEENSNPVLYEIYYLLADYYFKNLHTEQALKYYILDLGHNPDRFDSWAGVALVKSSDFEQQLRSIEVDFDGFPSSINYEAMLACFRKALSFKPSSTSLWVENGALAYMLHSTASRKLKNSELFKLNSEDREDLMNFKTRMLKIAQNCYVTASQTTESNQEYWLYCYMLGKIAEKLYAQGPEKYLDYYKKASECLNAQNAHYSKRINFHSPHHFSIEALEVFYRAHASVIKYLHGPCVSSSNEKSLKVITEFLDYFWSSPFVATVLPGPYQGKDARCALSYATPKQPIHDNSSGSRSNQICVKNENLANSAEVQLSDQPDIADLREEAEPESEGRMLNDITVTCLKGLTLCVNRFHQHYRSLYRLIHYYYNRGASQKEEFMEYARSLLMDCTPNPSGLDRPGYFGERKTANLFNNVWRIPVEEVDRPGSFPAHVCRSSRLLLEVLASLRDGQALFGVASQLRKTPDLDKKYIYDSERIQLYEIALKYAENILKEDVIKAFSSINLPHIKLDDSNSRKNYIAERYSLWREQKYLLEKQQIIHNLAYPGFPLPFVTPEPDPLESIFVSIQKFKEHSVDVFALDIF